MTWEKKYHYINQYEYTSTNQHGERFKEIAQKRVSVARLSTPCDNTADIKILILLSHRLDLPVRYDFEADPQVAYIEVVGKEAL